MSVPQLKAVFARSQSSVGLSLPIYRTGVGIWVPTPVDVINEAVHWLLDHEWWKRAASVAVIDAGMGDGRVAMGFSHLAATHQVLGIEYDPILFNHAVRCRDRLCKKKVVDPSRLHLVQGNYLDISVYQPIQEHLRGPCLVMNYPETRLGNHERLAEFLENNLSHELRLCLLSHTKIVKVGQFGQDSCHEIQATDGSLWWASLFKLREAQ